MNPVAESLVLELEQEVGLEPVDAHRGAFTALACAAGWPKARVGRYLGISRARVGQKLDKLLHYGMTMETTPTLTKVVRDAYNRKPKSSDYDKSIGFELESWDDLDFARTIIDGIRDADANRR